MGVDAEDRMAAVSRESLLAMANLGTHTPFLASDFSPAFSSFFRTHLRFQLLNFSTVVTKIEPFLNRLAKKKSTFQNLAYLLCHGQVLIVGRNGLVRRS
jgi:hypothetical protein